LSARKANLLVLQKGGGLRKQNSYRTRGGVNGGRVKKVTPSQEGSVNPGEVELHGCGGGAIELGEQNPGPRGTVSYGRSESCSHSNPPKGQRYVITRKKFGWGSRRDVVLVHTNPKKTRRQVTWRGRTRKLGQKRKVPGHRLGGANPQPPPRLPGQTVF